MARLKVCSLLTTWLFTSQADRKPQEKDLFSPLFIDSTHQQVHTQIHMHPITAIFTHTNTPTLQQILPLQSKRGSGAGAESQRWGKGEEGGTL